MIQRLLQISFRNILRNKRRSILTLSILILGSTGLILVGGFFENLKFSYREQLIHSQTGHLQVNRVGYYKKGSSAPFDYLIENAGPLQNALESDPQVLYTVPRLKFGGMVSNENASVAVLAVGTDPIKERRMGMAKAPNADYAASRIVEGKDLDPEIPNGVLLGKGLMNNLGVKVGDSINFLTTGRAGTIDGAEYFVRGTFETIAKDFDDRAMKVPLKSAQELLGLEDQVHSMLVILYHTQNTQAVNAALAPRLAQLPENFELITWEEQGVFYAQASEMLDHFYVTIQLIICVIFFFSIAITMNMTLLERMREFGTMMAMGNGRGVIFATIVLEAAMLGILGSVLGLIVGAATAELVSAVGIEMPPIPMGSSGYYAMITLSPGLLAKTLALVLGASLLSALVPAYRASHFRIVQALGYV